MNIVAPFFGGIVPPRPPRILQRARPTVLRQRIRIRLPTLPHLAAFMADRSPQVAVVGGYRSGKTTAMASKLVASMALDSQRRSGLRGLIAGLDYQQVMDVLYLKLTEILESNKIRHRYSPSQRHLYIKDFNDYVLVIGSADPKAQSWKKWDGKEFAHIALDEVAKMPIESYKHAMTRLSNPYADYLQLISGSTPEGRGWFWDWFAGAPRPGTSLHSISTLANAYLPRVYVDQLTANFEGVERRAYLRGEFVTLAGKVYASFLPDHHVVDCADYDPAVPVDMCFDFNVNPMTCLLSQLRSGRVLVLDEVILKPGTTEETVRAALSLLKSRLPPTLAPPRIRVYGDASGRARSPANRVTNYGIIYSMLSDLRVEMRVKTQNPPQSDRIDSVNALARQDRLYVHRRCKDTIVSLQKTEYRSGAIIGGANMLDKTGNCEHATDALGYRIEYDFGMRRGARVVRALTAVGEPDTMAA